MATERETAADTPVAAEFAPAKVNLCLHVTGRRPDGYHLLDSLVVFAGVGDRVTVLPGKGLTLKLSGPEAAGLPVADDNLVLAAARVMGVSRAELRLWKALPVASGIGGGSADAAATLRALSRLTGQALPGPAAVLSLGADVPVCLAGKPARMAGLGEFLADLPPLPELWLVLANPRVAVPTPLVFSALIQRENPAVPGFPSAARQSAEHLACWLAKTTRNDLAPPAGIVAPVLARVQSALAALPGCLLSRMSGSGGTHFGIFASAARAEAAAAALRAAEPGWWVASAKVRA